MFCGRLRALVAASGAGAAAASAPRASLHGSPRLSGVLDNINGYWNRMQDRTSEDQRLKVFEFQLQLCADPEIKKVAPEHYLQMLREMMKLAGVSGFRKNLPWVQNREEFQELKNQEDFLLAMDPVQLAMPGKLRPTAVKMLCEKAGVPIEAGQAVESGIVMLDYINDYIKRRSRRAMPLPRSSDELERLFLTPCSGVRRKRRFPKWWKK